MSGKGKGRKPKNRIDYVLEKLKRANDFRELLKDPKRFENHLEEARQAYITTGAWLDYSGLMDSWAIMDEIARDIGLASKYYDFSIDSELFFANMIEDRAEMQRICRKYTRAESSESRSAKAKAKKLLMCLKPKQSLKKYTDHWDEKRKEFLAEKKMKRMTEKARAAEKKYWGKPSIKREMSLNRVGRFIDGSDAKREFLENRVANHFAEAKSLGFDEHKLEELTMYYNGMIVEYNDVIVDDTKKIMRDELKKLGVPSHYARALMTKLDRLRKDYLTQKVAFYAAYNNAAVEN